MNYNRGLSQNSKSALAHPLCLLLNRGDVTLKHALLILEGTGFGFINSCFVMSSEVFSKDMELYSETYDVTDNYLVFI